MRLAYFAGLPDSDILADFHDVRLDYFRKRVTVRGPLSEEQRVRLEEISRRCPVHRTLTGTIRIDDELRVETATPGGT